MPVRNRSDFKQVLSTLHRLQQEAGEEPHLPSSSQKHSSGSWYGVHFLQDEIGKVPDGLLAIQKVKKEVCQVLSERDY